MKVCPICEYMNQDAAVVCKECSTSLKNVESKSLESVEAHEIRQKNTRRKKSLIVFHSVFLTCFFAIHAWLLYLYLLDGTSLAFYAGMFAIYLVAGLVFHLLPVINRRVSRGKSSHKSNDGLITALQVVMVVAMLLAFVGLFSRIIIEK